VSEKDNRTTPVNAEVDSTAEFQNGIYENASVESMNKSGIDYIWGSDQDDLIKEIKEQEKGE
jgi:hypothetical protein